MCVRRFEMNLVRINRTLELRSMAGAKRITSAALLAALPAANVLSLACFRHTAAEAGAPGERQGLPPQPRMRLYFIDAPPHLWQCRLTAVFDDQPRFDEIVLRMSQNGFGSLGELHGQPVESIFASTNASFADRRAMINTLKQRAYMETRV